MDGYFYCKKCDEGLHDEAPTECPTCGSTDDISWSHNCCDECDCCC
jgi:rubrerythrin